MSEEQSGLAQKDKRATYFFWAAAAIIGVIGYRTASSLAWKCDDIFITLRYIKNWLNGDGIVYNKGEYVEGYTHFLWMLLVSLFQKLGGDPVKVSINLGLISYVLTLFVWARNSFKIKAMLPLTVIGLAFHYEFNIWATSGLESMFFTLLLSTAVSVAFFSKWDERKKLIVTGVLLYLNILVRPDGVLFVATSGVVYLGYALLSKKSFKQLIIGGLWLNAGLFVILVPYLLWKVNYYGDVFPNTYYAKSGGGSNYTQGWVYLKSYIEPYWISLLWVVGLAVAAILTLVKTGAKTLFRNPMMTKALALTFVMVVYAVFFIARVGGGFMYARFLVPIIPLAFFVVELSMVTIWEQLKTKMTAKYVSAGVLALVLGWATASGKDARNEFLLKEDEKTGELIVNTWNGIVDERYYYVNHYVLDRFTEIGEKLRRAFRGLDVRVLQRGDCCMVYYAEFPYVLENFGLTDSTIARAPLDEKAMKRKVGHQRKASLDYIEERKIHFCFQRGPYVKDNFRFVQFGLPGGIGYRAEMFYYDKPLVKELQKRMGANFKFTDMEQLTEYYIQVQAAKDAPETIRETFAKYDKYYFQHNDDKVAQDQKKRFRDLVDSLAN